ncbi:WXG100 family type VII secretion target [Streptomyces melanosporofaciens]
MSEPKNIPDCSDRTGMGQRGLAELVSMIQNADWRALSTKATALQDAETALDKIGDELKKRVQWVEWDGDGGDAFREWGDEFAKQVMKLASYAGGVGGVMLHASDMLKEAITQMPEVPAGNLNDDPETLSKLQKKSDGLRDKFAPYMTRVANAYQSGADSFSFHEPPVFKPLPTQVLPAKDSYQGGELGYDTPGGAGGVGATPYAGTTSPGNQHLSEAPTPAGHLDSVGNAPGLQGADHLPTPDATNTNIDRVTMPEAPSTPKPSDLGPLPTPAPPTNNPAPVVPPIPSLPSPSNMRRPGPGPGPLGRVGPVSPVTGPGIGNDRIPAPTRTNSPIVGGLPPQGQTAATRGLNRGTIIGNESPQAMGRGMMGGGGSGVIGGGNRPTGSARRLPSEPTAGRRDFTPGGTGLVRGGVNSGGAPVNRRSRSDDGDDETRAGYLMDDDDQVIGRRDIVPPVIE